MLSPFLLHTVTRATRQPHVTHAADQGGNRYAPSGLTCGLCPISQRPLVPGLLSSPPNPAPLPISGCQLVWPWPAQALCLSTTCPQLSLPQHHLTQL